MRKTVVTLFFAFGAILAHSQTYTKKVINGDTVVIVVQTVTLRDTFKKADTRQQLAHMEYALKDGERREQEQKKLNDFYKSEIDRLKNLKSK